MKTQNLTPWCNLFSIASKFNVKVYKSYYKPLIYIAISQLIVSLLLLYFSYAYQLALVHAVITTLLLGILYSAQKHNRPVLVKDKSLLYHFEITNQGVCTFDGNKHYQLQGSSRLSFFGCWLFFLRSSPIKSLNVCQHKHLFIFKDSLTEQDFSRLSAVLAYINAQA
ncbi:MAG: hypothetical protein QF552_07485 [Litorilituus sp.]|nr:hypothetical protein [Litorilituus sp.]